MSITVFGDVVCPFTYAGLVMLRNERAQRGVDVPLRMRAWPLEWINGRPLDPVHVEAEIAGLRSVVSDLFNGFRRDAFATTSIAALALIDVAYEQGDEVGEAVGFEVREALFEDGVDIGDSAALATIAARHHITVPDRAEAELRVNADHDRGTALGVVGSPHFITDQGSWFCPLLHVSQVDGVVTVRIDDPARAQFLAAVFGDD